MLYALSKRVAWFDGWVMVVVTGMVMVIMHTLKRRLLVERAAGIITLLVELMRDKGELSLSAEGKQALYGLLCEVNDSMSWMTRQKKEKGGQG